MTQTGTTIKHDDNSTVYKVTKNSLINQFSLVGRLNTMHSKNASSMNIDIVDLMDDLTPTANNLFKMIKDNLDAGAKIIKVSVMFMMMSYKVYFSNSL